MSTRFAKVFKYSVLIVLLVVPLSKTVDAESTRVFLDPPSQTVGSVGDSFTVNVSIADVFDLHGYGFELYYNSTSMDGTRVAEGSFLRSGGQTFFLPSLTYHYNSTHGVVEVACALLGNVSGMNGSGVLATIEFKSLAAANSASLRLTDVRLVNSTASLIPNEVSHGMVTVVPEFTSLIAFLALIAASPFTVLIEKRAKRKVENFNS
jgi:hypothetical protein